MILLECDNCLHLEVCKYTEEYSKLYVEIPDELKGVIKVDIACLKFKDYRFYKVIRPMGAE